MNSSASGKAALARSSNSRYEFLEDAKVTLVAEPWLDGKVFTGWRILGIPYIVPIAELSLRMNQPMSVTPLYATADQVVNLKIRGQGAVWVYGVDKVGDAQNYANPRLLSFTPSAGQTETTFRLTCSGGLNHFTAVDASSAGWGFLGWQGDPAVAGSTAADMYSAVGAAFAEDRDTEATFELLPAAATVTAVFARCGEKAKIADLAAALVAPNTATGVSDADLFPAAPWRAPEGQTGLTVFDDVSGARWLTFGAEASRIPAADFPNTHADTEVSFRYRFAGPAHYRGQGLNVLTRLQTVEDKTSPNEADWTRTVYRAGLYFETNRVTLVDVKRVYTWVATPENNEYLGGYWGAPADETHSVAVPFVAGQDVEYAAHVKTLGAALAAWVVRVEDCPELAASGSPDGDAVAWDAIVSRTAPLLVTEQPLQAEATDCLRVSINSLFLPNPGAIQLRGLTADVYACGKIPGVLDIPASASVPGGASLYTYPAPVDFGEVELFTTAVRKLNVWNVGYGAAEVSVGLSPGADDDIAVEPSTAQTTPPGHYAAFTLRYTPTHDKNEFSDCSGNMLNIVVNDTTIYPYCVAGKVVTMPANSALVIEPEVLDFGTVTLEEE